MSVIFNPALIAARAYVRPTPLPAKGGFVIDPDTSSGRPRGIAPSNRRTAPAVEISLSPEALDLLAKARTNARDGANAQTQNVTNNDAAGTRGAGLSFEDFVTAQSAPTDFTYSAPGTGSDRAHLQPGSQLDITL